MHIVNPRSVLLGTLPAELLQYNRISDLRHFQDLVRIQVIQRMRHNQQRQAVDLKVFRSQTPWCQERRGNNGGSGNAVFFQESRVMDTPRRAAPSVTPGVDDALNLAQELVGNQTA